MTQKNSILTCYFFWIAPTQMTDMMSNMAVDISKGINVDTRT